MVRAVPYPQEGRIAIVTDVGLRDAMAGSVRKTSAAVRTVKACGPGAPMLASSLG